MGRTGHVVCAIDLLWGRVQKNAAALLRQLFFIGAIVAFFPGLAAAQCFSGPSHSPNSIPCPPSQTQIQQIQQIQATQQTATAATQTSTVSGTVLTKVLSGIREHIATRGSEQRERQRQNQGLQFSSDDSDIDHAIAFASDKKAKRVASNPLYAKAPPKLEPAPLGLAVWSQIYGDYERRSGIVDGFDTARTTTTGGFLVGADKLFTNVSLVDVMVLGILTGDMSAHTRNADGSSARITAPSVGAYGIWMFGPGLSFDASVKADFLDIRQKAADGTSSTFGSTNISVSANLNRKIELQNSYIAWFEPTVGVINTRSDWNAAGVARGLTDGVTTRVQAGSRFGSNPFDWGQARVDATVTLLGYEDVSIRGGTVLTALAGAAVPTDQGKLFGQGSYKLNFDWSKITRGLTSFAEGDLRGRSGVLGVAGRIGVRYTW